MKFLELLKIGASHVECKLSRLSWHNNREEIQIHHGSLEVRDLQEETGLPISGAMVNFPDNISVEDLLGDDWIPNNLNSKGLYPCTYKCGADTKATLYFHSNTKVEVRCIECDGVKTYDVMDVMVKETKLHLVVVETIKNYYNSLRKKG